MPSSLLSRIPVATYRLQFNRTFTFVDAANIVPYLFDLGITDCYTSSYLKAIPDSPHGYDIADPTTLNPEIGTDEEFRALVNALTERDMGQILDVVPNHMGIGKSSNRWWLDVLENGPSSHYAAFFDIDWRPLKPELADKVLLPILAEQYGTTLEQQEIVLDFEHGSFFVRYCDNRLPITSKSAVRILTYGLDERMRQLGECPLPWQELQSIVTALIHLPAHHERNPERIAERYREQDVIKRRLATLVNESEEIRNFLSHNMARFNGTKDNPKSFDLLDALLGDQPYRLAYWRVASEEINYRRFFDINELAAVRMEDPAVFETAHQLIFRLLKEGAVTGLRIDHVDGLYSPASYLRQIQSWAAGELAATHATAGLPLYLIVEKILGKNESLPDQWPVHGTTGYDFLNLVGGLFVNGSNERAFGDLYRRFTGTTRSFDDLVYECKQLIMRVSMASEINVLGNQLNRISEGDRRFRDFTLNLLTHAIRDIIACFPIYRTYVTEDAEEVSGQDCQFIQTAVAKAKRRNPALSGDVFDFVQMLLLKRFDSWTGQQREEPIRFAMKFQQLTGPVTAKGVEDTAFYRFNRLLSLNEVGGDPTQFGVAVSTFHEQIQRHRGRWPLTLSATSTHDNKRSEDVRARLNVLSEMPQAWKSALVRWSKLNRKHKTMVEGQPAPDRNEEYLAYQTLVGVWPIEPLDETQYRNFCDRIQAYMGKALKEAKVHTSWVNPDRQYDQAVHDFIDRILNPAVSKVFLDDFAAFRDNVSRFGMCNSLSQLTLKIAAPGIPDFYQGTELWDFSLVDPDNRRPVDYTVRRELLDKIQAACDEHHDRRLVVRELVEQWTDGRIKLYVTATGLQYRKQHADLFLQGDYVPLHAHGVNKDHVCVFARIHQDRAIMAAVPRLITGLIPAGAMFPQGAEAWGETWVTVPSWKSGSQYRNIFTGELLTSSDRDQAQVLPAAALFAEFPVALLERLT